MKKLLNIILPLYVFVFIGFSCTDPVTVTVPNGGKRLVVEASINWEKGTTGAVQTIVLTTSTGYFNANTMVPVQGAVVTVTKNDNGAQFVFQDQNNGKYIATNFKPQLRQSYTLSIDYNGQRYEAIETLMPVSKINRITQGVESGLNEESIRLDVFFDDPSGVKNHYLGEFIPDGAQLLSLETLDDEFTDGNENFMEHDNDNIKAGDMIGVRLYGISERYYNYINLLIEQSGINGGGGGPFQTTPVQLKGNCININNPEEEVLGYFRLSEVDRTSYVVK